MSSGGGCAWLGFRCIVQYVDKIVLGTGRWVIDTILTQTGLLVPDWLVRAVRHGRWYTIARQAFLDRLGSVWLPARL